MIINKQAIEDFFVSLLTLFNKALEAPPGEWSETATEVPSTAGENLYKWFGRFPGMRRWIGEKFIKSLEAYKYTITNAPFEATIEVLRDDIEDDNTGSYGIQATSIGQSANEWPGDLVNEAKNNAFTSPCYDGQYFYDTDHPVGGASVSNRITAALSGATIAAANASYGAARTAMMGFKDEEGKNLGLKPTILEVAGNLDTAAKIILQHAKLTDGTENPYRDTAKLIVNPGLADSTWLVHCTSKAIKPFIYQPRKKPQFVKMTDSESENVFMRARYYFGVEARGEAGYSFWQLSVGGKP